MLLDGADDGSPPAKPPAHRRNEGWGPIGLFLRLFSSVWFGVILLIMLFIYSSIGSAGAPVGEGVLHWPFILNPDAWISVRQLRPFEMTEMEWFHWWPFDLLIGLICLNLIVATIRRIKLNVVNLGVWMIHAGIIILAAGSVWYFSTKVEGDSPVGRRRLVIELPGHGPVSMSAMPGNSLVVGQGADAYSFQVRDIDPSWEIRSGADAGKKAYSVSVRVQSKTGEFTRQLLSGYPQYTEDVIRTDDQQQPMKRAIKAIGKPLVDEALKLSLEYDPQSWFYLVDSHAVYLREVNAGGEPKTPWVQRPVRGLPRYQDYIRDYGDAILGPPVLEVRAADGQVRSFDAVVGESETVGQGDDAVTVTIDQATSFWHDPAHPSDDPHVCSVLATVTPKSGAAAQQRVVEGQAQKTGGVRLTVIDNAPPLSGLEVAVPSTDPNDPLKGVPFTISRYLRYANLETRRKPVLDSSSPINPAVNVSIRTSQGESQQYQLVAFDAENNAAVQGNLLFVWVNSPAEIERLKTRTDPMIRFSAPGGGKSVDIPILKTLADTPSLEFAPIEGTEYQFRVQGFQDGLAIGDATSVAIIELRKDDKMWQRWVFDDPSKNRDLAMASGMEQHAAGIPLDAGLQTVYVPGQRPPAPVMVIAGPEEHDLAAMITMATGQPRFQPVKQGDVVPIASGVTLSIDKYAARTVTETKPAVVPREQRDRDVKEMLSMIRLDIPGVAGGKTGGGADAGSAGGQSAWLPYHLFAFETPDEVLRRFPYRPTTIKMPDGRRIEFMFSRERLPLPGAVVLDDFVVDSTIGGFTGQTSSITDWKSMVRFAAADGSLTPPMKVSVNKPTEFKGHWFFQAQWDPPDPARAQGEVGSKGLNYTVLGVGNRNGVNVQLFGACLSVIGMLYAFYAKPVIKRRRQQAVLAKIEAGDFGQKAKARAEHKAAVEVES